MLERLLKRVPRALLHQLAAELEEAERTARTTGQGPPRELEVRAKLDPKGRISTWSVPRWRGW